ncbi:MAG: hypothetical protein CO118_04795 [Flavobacteriales bacterium CG_4_9_14_3_um_filter_32_8]|nr:MAG: hypothetical protein CO118_04795 [Flavobacteriales bacterium CG_4_9_14_3_um_filter_32_8]
MKEEELIQLEILKKEVAKTLQQSYAVSLDIKNWKGQEIIYLQDDLAEKINGRISEKWFYTHIKSNSGKLPRIDMLNILCEYAGYQNWNDLQNKFPQPKTSKIKPNKKYKSIIFIILIIAILFSTFIVYQFFSKKNSYQFCFVDSDLKAPITNSPIWIFWMNDKESPMVSKCDSMGCFHLETKSDKIQFIVKSAYFKTDTITRIVYDKKINEEQIQLKTNDYALMIHFFSKSKVKNWKERRQQLNQMLADNAMIYQVYEDGKTGMELYNKKDFINKLTVPLKSLKNIEIIETIYNGDKISILKFKQNQE